MQVSLGETPTQRQHKQPPKAPRMATDAAVHLICLSSSLVVTRVEKHENENLFAFDTSSCGSSGAQKCSGAAPRHEPETHLLVHKASNSQQRHQLVPWLLRLFFYSPFEKAQRTHHGEQPLEQSGRRFLSYAESQHELSIVFDEANLELFPDQLLEFDPIRWKALQVASAGTGTGVFPNQLVMLQELTSQLAKQNISVFQISTYQTDYVLVKAEDLNRAIECLESFCHIEDEEGTVLTSNRHPQSLVHPMIDLQQAHDPSTLSVDPNNQDADISLHSHVLSTPFLDFWLVQIQKTHLRKHMYAIVRLLFFNDDVQEQSCHQQLESDNSKHLNYSHAKGKVFLSYSETEDEITIVTYDREFVDQMRQLADGAYDEGVIVSPDAWKVVQIGDQTLGFTETGIVASQASVLSDAGSTIFYLSTYATDFLLLKEDEWQESLEILRRNFRVVEGKFVPLLPVTTAPSETSSES